MLSLAVKTKSCKFPTDSGFCRDMRLLKKLSHRHIAGIRPRLSVRITVESLIYNITGKILIGDIRVEIVISGISIGVGYVEKDAWVCPHYTLFLSLLFVPLVCISPLLPVRMRGCSSLGLIVNQTCLSFKVFVIV